VQALLRGRQVSQACSVVVPRSHTRTLAAQASSPCNVLISRQDIPVAETCFQQSAESSRQQSSDLHPFRYPLRELSPLCHASGHSLLSSLLRCGESRLAWFGCPWARQRISALHCS